MRAELRAKTSWSFVFAVATPLISQGNRVLRGTANALALSCFRGRLEL